MVLVSSICLPLYTSSNFTIRNLMIWSQSDLTFFKSKLRNTGFYTLEHSSFEDDTFLVVFCLYSYNMEFTIESLSNGKQPKVVCSLCNEEDHYRDDCKDRIVGLKTLTLPPITDKMRKYLEQFCEITLSKYICLC